MKSVQLQMKSAGLHRRLTEADVEGHCDLLVSVRVWLSNVS